MNKKIFLFGIPLLLLITLPAIIFFSQKTQETRSHASASTTLELVPVNNSNSIAVGDTVSFDVIVHPGTTYVSFVQLDIRYDTNLLKPVSFISYPESFSNILEGPVDTKNGTAVTITSGGDPSKQITKDTKIGTLSLVALSKTGSTPTSITFGDNTKVLTLSAEAQHNENILSTTIPAAITISGDSSISPSPDVSTGTRLNLSVYLNGVGKAGDSTNTQPQSLNDKKPIHLTREMEILIYNNQNQLLASPKGTLAYNTEDGSFKGTIGIKDPLTTGAYLVKVKLPGYLTKQILGNQTITSDTENIFPSISLVAGDVNGDNTLNTVDYNLVQACYSTRTTSACTSNAKKLADLNDDGTIDAVDLNIFLREYSTKNGD